MRYVRERVELLRCEVMFQKFKIAKAERRTGQDKKLKTTTKEGGGWMCGRRFTYMQQCRILNTFGG